MHLRESYVLTSTVSVSGHEFSRFDAIFLEILQRSLLIYLFFQNLPCDVETVEDERIPIGPTVFVPGFRQPMW